MVLLCFCLVSFEVMLGVQCCFPFCFATRLTFLPYARGLAWWLLGLMSSKCVCVCVFRFCCLFSSDVNHLKGLIRPKEVVKAFKASMEKIS